METREIVVEMVTTLLEMGSDTYMRCKMVLLSVSREYPKENKVMEVIFNYTDRHRRPLIGCADAAGKVPGSGIKK